MDDLQQLGSTHESLVALIRRIPYSIIRAARHALGDPRVSPEDLKLDERTPTIEVPGVTRRAKVLCPDAVFTVHTADDRPIQVWVFDCQLSEDANKRWTWSNYGPAFAAEHHAHTQVVVIAPDPRLRAWLRKRVLPKVIPSALLLEPDHVELITDTRRALRSPRETIFGAIYHADSSTSRSGFGTKYL